MRIDGKVIAERMLTSLGVEVNKLKQRDINPTLAVILVGDNPASLSYIKQKQKAADSIGVNIVFSHQSSTISNQQLKDLIDQYNGDTSIHGLIVQRPLPYELASETLSLSSIKATKDVDGFVPNSPFQVPVAAAVFTILKEIFGLEISKTSEKTFEEWLNHQCAAVLGRGETAGKPIFEALANVGCATSVVHSKTTNPTEIVRKMSIVVSCVGKERVITADMVTPETILIGVGIWRDSEGKLQGDYEEEEIKDIVAYYTPTPGGVGPVNVACLMQNVVTAAKQKS